MPSGPRIRSSLGNPLGCVSLALIWLCVVPAIAQAETRSFIDTTPLFPSQGAGSVGPANEYPSTINVSGVPGAVTSATVTLFGYGSASPDDTDAVITGPNGQRVMLMSDVCGESTVMTDFSVFDRTWTFDDSAPTFAPNNGDCDSLPAEPRFKPSNYLGNQTEPDDLSPSGGPGPPYLNALSFLAGGSPNGAWNLFLLDENAGAGVGFDVNGWALTLEIEPSTDQGATDTTAPDTQITAAPKSKTKKRKASFAFTSSEPGSTFECKLDGAAFATCSSSLDVKVERGKHKFEVRATDAAGNVDPTPASSAWKVKKQK